MSKGSREEAMAAAGANSNSSSAAGGDYPHAIVKGKRTKRMRLLQVLAPRAPHAASSASSSGEQTSAGSTTTEEEVDTANSLIMLAKRPVVGTVVDSEPRLEEELGGGEGADAETATGGKAGSIVYPCKTCNKCFPSFQALGGHRASHNKPKAPQQPPATAEMEKRAMDEDGVKVSLASSHKINIGILPGNGGGGTTTPATVTVATTRSNNHSNGDNSDNANNHNNMMITASSNKPRVHECAICGSEFSSGQALGGHMRRHRAPAPAPAPKKERSILSLDLNLPAPMDDERASHSFGSSGKRPLIFLPSALVDCHH